MELVLRLINGSEIHLVLHEDMTVSKAKEVAKETSDLEGEISLIFKGRVLNDNEVLNKIDGIDKTFIIVHNKRKKQEMCTNFNTNGLTDFIPRLREFIRLASEPHNERDPPDFDQQVNNLVEMGFEKSVCIRAFRLSGYIPTIAATYLLSQRTDRLSIFMGPFIFGSDSNDYISDDEDDDINEESNNNQEDQNYIGTIDAIISDLDLIVGGEEEEEENLEIA